jgi:ABC-type phosphate/phosphonate transport system permease subunit
MSDDPFSESYHQWKTQLTDYVNARIDLAKLEAAENLSRFFASFVTKSVMLYFSLLALIFISFAFAYFLGNILDSISLGFLLTGVLYILLLLLFYYMRESIVERPVVRAVMRLFFHNRKKTNNEQPSL